MNHLLNLLQFYGLAFIFINVALSQAGLPIPAVPTLVAAGAILVPGQHDFVTVTLTATVAALLADLAWYGAGDRFGHAVLRNLCRVSLSPDDCVRQTESIYTRFGAPSLLVAKFIPGFAAVATGMAGTLRTPLWQFLLFDGLGAALWASVALGLGLLFRDAVASILATLSSLGHVGLGLLVLALVLVIAAKWWQRQRFFRELRMARISVEELRALLDRGGAPAILDVRSERSHRDGRIPGSIAVNHETIKSALADLDAQGEVIVYCACPNEASAAKLAKILMREGYTRVRPLLGGIDAWVAAGYSLER